MNLRKDHYRIYRLVLYIWPSRLTELIFCLPRRLEIHFSTRTSRSLFDLDRKKLSDLTVCVTGVALSATAYWHFRPWGECSTADDCFGGGYPSLHQRVSLSELVVYSPYRYGNFYSFIFQKPFILLNRRMKNLKHNTIQWITWLRGRWRTQLAARRRVNCRTHEHRHFERILRNGALSPFHACFRVGFTSISLYREHWAVAK